MPTLPLVITLTLLVYNPADGAGEASLKQSQRQER